MAPLVYILLEELHKKRKHQPGSETTRSASTEHSYKKVVSILTELVPQNAKIIDYGSGQGIGTQIMRGMFGPDVTVDSYEPHPENVKHAPTYHDYEEATGPYDAVVCLNVLNVLSPDLRYEVVSHIGKIIRPGGYAIIGTRGWNDDVANIKNVEPGEEPRSVWVLKKKSGQTVRVYQKGFDGNELQEYVRGVLGQGYEVAQMSGSKRIGRVSILVKKLSPKKPQAKSRQVHPKK